MGFLEDDLEKRNDVLSPSVMMIKRRIRERPTYESVMHGL
jgi:hypothetical protein